MTIISNHHNVEWPIHIDLHIFLTQVLGGELRIIGHRVQALSHFPSLRLGGIINNVIGPITVCNGGNGGTSSGGYGGRWFYEVTLLTDGLMQIGWYAT